MFKTLSTGAIGCNPPTLKAALGLAKLGGFGGLEIHAPAIADQIDREGADAVRKAFADAGIRPAAFGLPVDWRTTEENWRRGLDQLPRCAKAAADLAIERCATWVMPCSNERTLEQSIPFHIERFKYRPST